MTDNKNTALLREQLIMAVLKKRQCNTKAQIIVESLLEPQNSEKDFLDKLKFINPDHYNDIVDERHVLKICGYPLCDNKLTNIPSQQYSISSSKNKVFDLTVRKKFCCGFCFKASENIKMQIPKEPLWMRDHGEPSKFILLENIK